MNKEIGETGEVVIVSLHRNRNPKTLLVISVRGLPLQIHVSRRNFPSLTLARKLTFVVCAVWG